MGMYADYEFYTEKFGGGIIPQAAFPHWSARASLYLDAVTQHRITDATDEVQMACCEIAELYYKAELNGGQIVASESVGSWSRTFSSGAKSQEQLLYDAALLYLAGTGLMARWC